MNKIYINETISPKTVEPITINLLFGQARTSGTYGSLINDGDYIKFFIGGTKIPTRRQDFSESFIRNGQIYIFKASNVHEKNDYGFYQSS